MKPQTHTNLIIRSGLILALALAIWAPAQAQSAAPMDNKKMMPGKMTGSCQAMKEQRQKMMTEMKEQDAELTALVAKMNSAPANQKLDIMAAVVTQMVEQRTAMNARMEQMQDKMMKQMQTSPDSMSQAPMMKDTGEMDEKATDADSGGNEDQK
jgi:hypothetical protein